MRIPVMNLRAFVAAAFVIVGAAIAIGMYAPGANAARTKRWLLMSGGWCCVDTYPEEGLHRKREGRIQLVAIFGQGVDRMGTVYVGAQLPNGKYGVEVFPARSQTPSTTFAVPWHPTALAVRPDGTLYLAGNNNDVVVYPPGSKKPSGVIRIQDYDIFGTITALRFDARTGILYFNMSVTDSSIHDFSDAIYWVLPGSRIATGIIGIPWGSPGFIDTDSEGRVIVSLRRGVAVYCRNPWRRCRFLAFDVEPRGVTYDAAADRLYVGSRAHAEVEIYNYTTGLQVNTIQSDFGPDTITLSPVLP